MVPCQTALEINSIGGTDGAVRRKLNGAALNKGTGCHDDLVLIAGHIPGEGVGVGVHRCGGLKTGLVVYGVGDHGGGPTRRDVERGLEMQQWPIFPEIRFGTFREYFLEAESVRDRVPVVDRELNFAFPGCYTTQSRIKRGNRRSEAALSEAETAMALAHWNTGAPLHEKALTEAWQKVLFTHFHDILTGSCVQDSREYAMGLFQQALATANTETTLATRKLSDRIDTSGISVVPDPDSQAEGAGVGYASGSFDGHAATGRSGGKLKELADLCICVPETETFKVQELHLPVYHYLCAETEAHFFAE